MTDPILTPSECACRDHTHGAQEGKQCLCCDMNPTISIAEIDKGLRWLAAHTDEPIETNVGSEGRLIDTGVFLAAVRHCITAHEATIAELRKELEGRA